MRLTPILRVTAAVLLAGCNPLVCTDIGCIDSLQVRFDRAPVGAYRVEVVAGAGAEPAVFECGATESCPVAYFEGVTAERVTVRVTTAAGTRTQEFSPRYERQYPNGRLCGAACQQATITFSL